MTELDRLHQERNRLFAKKAALDRELERLVAPIAKLTRAINAEMQKRPHHGTRGGSWGAASVAPQVTTPEDLPEFFSTTARMF